MTVNLFASDTFTISAREITPEGYLVTVANIARTGIQEYLASELGLDGLDPMRRIKLYRPPEEVFAPVSVASFDGKPVTIDHPQDPVTSDNWKHHAVGDVTQTMHAGDYMTGRICLREKAAIAALDAGKRELSNGYTFTLDLTPGVAPSGEAYDGVQRNIRGNHLALVDAARCGSACRVPDSKPTNPKGNQTMTTRKVVVDGIAVEANDAAASAIEKLIKDRDEALQRAKDAQATNDAALKAVTEAKDKEIADLKKDVMTPDARDAMVKDWASMLAEAKRIAPSVTTDGKTCLQVRRDVLAELTSKDATAKAVANAVLAGKELATADADTIRATFNAVAATVKTEAVAAGNDSAMAAALAGQASAITAVDAHDIFVQRMTNSGE